MRGKVQRDNEDPIDEEGNKKTGDKSKDEADRESREQSRQARGPAMIGTAKPKPVRGHSKLQKLKSFKGPSSKSNHKA